MKDTQEIKVSIAGRVYPLTIERGEEKNIRNAAKAINKSVTDYKKKFDVNDIQDLLAMTSLLFATQLTNKTKPIATKKKSKKVSK